MGGADHQLDRRVFQDLGSFAHFAGLRELAAEAGDNRRLAAGEVDGDQFGSGVQQALGLPEDMVMVDPDDGETDAGLRGHGSFPSCWRIGGAAAGFGPSVRVASHRSVAVIRGDGEWLNG